MDNSGQFEATLGTPSGVRYGLDVVIDEDIPDGSGVAVSAELTEIGRAAATFTGGFVLFRDGSVQRAPIV
jgi:galactokinase